MVDRKPARLKILFVEDEPSLLEGLEFFFKNVAEVYCAPEGRAALSILKKNKIDIVLTDLNMPNGMSGFDLIKQIREEKIPVKLYVFSGYNANEVELLPVDGYFNKPVTFSELRTKLLGTK